MLQLLGLNFLKYVGGTTLILVLLIVLVSVMGGITYDTSTTDRSWGGWNLTINIHPGKCLENIQGRIENREKNKDDNTEPFLKLDRPEKGDLNDRKRILPPRPVNPGK